jgi:polysaccharide export outer membrane protein
MRLQRFLVLVVALAALVGCARPAPLQYHYVAAPMAVAPMPYPAQPGYPAPVAQAPAYPAQSYPRPLAAPAPAYRAFPAPPACTAQGCPGSYGATVYSSAYQPGGLQGPYTLDAGDRLRITVFGQEGLTNSYAVDAAGFITVPLVGAVPARGYTTEQLSQSLAERLRQGYIREPQVAIEIEAYRPFFIHGEVATPGQYPYVANMTVENAIAIAGGFGPRADKSKVSLSRTIGGQTSKATVGLNYTLRPGDTLRVGERWF